MVGIGIPEVLKTGIGQNLSEVQPVAHQLLGDRLVVGVLVGAVVVRAGVTGRPFTPIGAEPEDSGIRSASVRFKIFHQASNFPVTQLGEAAGWEQQGQGKKQRGSGGNGRTHSDKG